MNIKCIIGGRFQPPHKGHFAIYSHCKTIFKNVYIVSSNKIQNNSPFSFNEKKFIWKEMFDVDLEYSSNPTFQPTEILKENDIYVSVTSEKDKNRFSHTKYFEQYGNTNLKSWEDKAYYYIAPILEDNISATHIRENIKYNREFFTETYGKFNQKVFDLFNERI